MTRETVDHLLEFVWDGMTKKITNYAVEQACLLQRYS